MDYVCQQFPRHTDILDPNNAGLAANLESFDMAEVFIERQDDQLPTLSVNQKIQIGGPRNVEILWRGDRMAQRAKILDQIMKDALVSQQPRLLSK